MRPKDQPDHRLVCWNGVSIIVPDSWEAKVSGSHHLHFEMNFEAVMEMRWHQAPLKDIEGVVRSSAKQYEQLMGKVLSQTALPDNLKTSLSHFTVHCFAAGKKATPQLIFLYDDPSSTFLMLQFFRNQSEPLPLQCLGSIRCISASDLFSPWAIQDISITIPGNFVLMNYTMAAGLTTLHFQKDNVGLHICRLAPASVRLRRNSLDEIFASLLDVKKDTDLEWQNSGTSVRCRRDPGLFRQMLLRLQRKKPFQLATLRHDPTTDRLLGVFMEGIYPLDEQLHHEISASYEISQT